MKVSDAPRLKTLVRVAMSRPSRKGKAELLNFAFFAAVRLHREIRDTAPPEDAERLDQISNRTDPLTGRGLGDEAQDHEDFAWIRRCYPHLALVNDVATAVMEIIGSRKFYRELGFATHEAWYAALDDEGYLQAGMQRLAEWEERER